MALPRSLDVFFNCLKRPLLFGTKHRGIARLARRKFTDFLEHRWKDKPYCFWASRAGSDNRSILFGIKLSSGSTWKGRFYTSMKLLNKLIATGGQFRPFSRS